MAEHINTSVVSLPPGDPKDKIPAHKMLQICKRLEMLSRRHKRIELNARRTMLLRKYEDIRLFAEKNPFMFYSFTEDTVSPSRRAVYKKMIEIRIDIESGKISENDGNALMGDVCRANP